MLKPTSSPLLPPSACALILGLTMISHTHPAVARISASDTPAPPTGTAFEQPVAAEDGAIRGSGYWEWSDGGYLWSAGNWGSTIGLHDGAAYVYGLSGEGFSGGNGQDQPIYYHTTVSHVSINDNVGGLRARPPESGEKIHDKSAAGSLATRGAPGTT
jgi:hypothetical protein